MKFSALLIIAVCLTLSTHSQNNITQTGSDISPEQAALLLSHHNKVRKEVGAPPLIWNQELAAYAQRWADYLVKENRCQMKHRSEADREGKQFGENIFWGSDKTVYPPSRASVSWYSEIEDYKYAPLNEQNWYKTGHYTQMVWKNTLRVGAGVAYCPSGALIVVANYDPPGNYLGQTPY